MSLQPPRGHNNMIFSFSWLQFPCGCYPLGHSIWPGGMRVSDPPPHRRWRRVLDSQSKSLPISIKPQVLSFKSLGLEFGLPPLYLSPGPRTFRRAGPKKRKSLFFSVFLSIIWPSATDFQICFEKSSKKVRKSRILASQNHPKIHSKCFRKRCPNKHVIFQRFWLEKASVARAPTLDFCWQGHSFVSFSQNSVFRFSHAFLVPKTSQKPSRNDVRALPKSMSALLRQRLFRAKIAEKSHVCWGIDF